MGQSEPQGLETVFSEGQIQERIDLMAREMSRNYVGQTLHVISISEAGFMFLADLVRGFDEFPFADVTTVCEAV